MVERDRLPGVPRLVPDDVADADFYRLDLSLERDDWPLPSVVPYAPPDEVLHQELPHQPAPFPPDDDDQPRGWDDIEPY